MKLDELLKHESLILPKNWKSLGYSSYYDCVTSEGRNFLNLLDKLDDTENYSTDEYIIGKLSKKNLISVSRDFYRMVIDALQCYFNKGNPHETYNIINDSLIKTKYLASYLEYTTIHSAHYRLRKEEGKIGLGDIFHVPFELRHVINSNRYSIPGHPTLYFSNSIFLAYKELGEPDYDNLHVSKFLHTKHFNWNEKLLDMTNKPLLDDIESKFKFLARWILTMACSIEVNYPDSPFKAEYILPQIIFQWVNNMDMGHQIVRGVQYSSTKIIDNKEDSYGNFYNTAIPIHHSNKNGYCDVLSKLFCLTQPISFHKALEHETEMSQRGQVKSIGINDIFTEYMKTDFSKIEQVINEFPLYYVNGEKFSW